MDCRKPVVAGYAAASTNILHVIQEFAHDGGREILYRHPIDCAAAVFTGKREQQRQCVTITGLRIAGKVALAHQVFKQEASDPRAHQRLIFHEALSDWAYSAKRWLASCRRSVVMWR